MKKTVLRSFLIAGLLCAGFSLPGCVAGAVIAGIGAKSIFLRPDVNLLEKSYAAADYLSVQARHFMKPGSQVRAEPLSETHQPETTSEIARVIPEQVGTRLSQLGHAVDLSEVKTAGGGNALGFPQVPMRAPAYILGGDYWRKDDNTLSVSLRLYEARTGRIVAALDYTMPMNAEIEDLSAPRAKIFRVHQ